MSDGFDNTLGVELSLKFHSLDNKFSFSLMDTSLEKSNLVVLILLTEMSIADESLTGDSSGEDKAEVLKGEKHPPLSFCKHL